MTRAERCWNCAGTDVLKRGALRTCLSCFMGWVHYK